jgi:hypothetical protein
VCVRMCVDVYMCVYECVCGMCMCACVDVCMSVRLCVWHSLLYHYRHDQCAMNCTTSSHVVGFSQHTGDLAFPLHTTSATRVTLGVWLPPSGPQLLL